VTAVGGLYALKGRITTPDTLTAHFEFAELPVVWRHRLWGAVERDAEFSNGVTIYGEKETVFVTDNRWIVMPAGRNAQRVVHDANPPQDLSRLHVAEWLQAVREKKQPSMTPEEALKSTTMVQLAMIAYERKRTLDWDDQKQAVAGDAEALRMMARAYRSPYKHPGL